jgi:hypothetical protein
MLSANDVVAPFGLQTRYARSAGAPRATRQGKPLGGFYTETDVSFAVSDGVVSNDDVMVAEFVDRAMDRLPLNVIDQIVGSGGGCFFLIGVYSEGNIMCDFGPALLSRLARHHIGLKLDFYGGPESGNVSEEGKGR